MRTENLNERMLYFQAKLKDAQTRFAAREAHPRTFDAGYTTETFKTWPQTIDLIKERIATIKEQIKRDKSFY